ncbi:MAG TPA: chemotaxis protein CheB [Polyangiales bacterium]|nr:chemotaxis protein CheB [Polyangiales bacterium]
MSTTDQSLAQFRAAAVVIGGSAGAVEVLGKLLPRLPATGQVPVIVIVHLPPRRLSLLPRLFAARCQLPVREPDDKQPVGPGIWFAPPDYHLLIEADHCFALSIDAPVKFSRPSIDVLFESAARVYGAGLLGVLLTGANDDGMLGACAIRKLGGVLAVQDPETAEAQEMPKAAIRRAAPQLVGTVEELASMMHMATGGTP